MLNEAKKPVVLLVGTFQMRPTRDMFDTKVDDLLSPRRQREIQEVVERIKQFNPTKVAVEIDTEKHGELNEEYKKYITNTNDLKVDEVHQVGFRIAAEMNHNEIFAIDWTTGRGKRPYGEVYEWAKLNQPELFNSIFNDFKERESNDDKSILEMYRESNADDYIKKMHEGYINMARIGNIGYYIGMDWLLWWYERNLIIYSNIARLANSPEDRVILIIGSSHVQILKQFLEETGAFNVELVVNYLA